MLPCFPDDAVKLFSKTRCVRENKISPKSLLGSLEHRFGTIILICSNFEGWYALVWSSLYGS